MADLDNDLKHTLERLFGMRSGYVLDFTNNTFADFIQTSVGFNPYERYVGSKASVLRDMWRQESNSTVSKLMIEMLERWRTDRLLSGAELTPPETDLLEGAIAKLLALGTAPSEASAADLAFLERDLGTVDLTRLQVALTSKEVLQQRLDEIERCMGAEAPLAVVFLCGSTLEGLLLEVAKAQAASYIASRTAPKRQGRVRPLDQWSLADLITVSREQGVVGEDVARHADAVRNFRNYIHPRQQVAESFTPRMITAEIARKVLMASLADLSRLGPRGLA
jgi:hypothetical protein